MAEGDVQHKGEYVDGGDFGKVWECDDDCPADLHEQLGGLMTTPTVLDGKEGEEAFIPADPERALMQHVCTEAATFFMFNPSTKNDPRLSGLRRALSAWWSFAVEEI